MTYDRAPTHWYLNASSVPDEALAAWQTYVATATGLIMFIAVSADNPLD